MNRLFLLRVKAALLTVGVSALVAYNASAGENLTSYQQAADRLAVDMSSRSTAVFVGMLDFDTITETAFTGTGFSIEEKTSFRAGMETGKLRLADKIIGQISERGYVKVLRVKHGYKHVKALLRLDYGDLGYGYMDLHLRKKGNDVRIINWYDYSAGQTYTDNLNQLIAMIAPTPTLIGRIFDIATDRSSDVKNLQKFINAVNKEGYESARIIHRKLSDEVANSRIVSILLVNAANTSQNDEYYRNALERLAKYHGHDTTLTFILIDYYYYLQNYDKAISSLDMLMGEFGVSDAALLAMKANALVEKDDYRSALKSARMALDLEPGLENVYWSLLSAYIGMNQYKDAVNAADVLETRFDYLLNRETLADNSFFQGFLESRAFKNWKAGSAR